MAKDKLPAALLVRTLAQIGPINPGEGPVGYGEALANRFVREGVAEWCDREGKPSRKPVRALRPGEAKALAQKEAPVRDEDEDWEEDEDERAPPAKPAADKRTGNVKSTVRK